MSEWPQKRLRFVADLNPPVRADFLDSPETELSFLPMEAVGVDGSLDLSRTRPVAEVRNGYSYFEDGDVAFAKVTPCFENGKGALMQGLEGRAGFGTTELTILRPKPGTNARFLKYITQSERFRQLGVGAMTGAGGLKRVPDEFTRDFPNAWPEPLDQARIADFLDEQTARIDALIAEKERLLLAINELFNSRLGNAVVAGLDRNKSLVPAVSRGFESVREDWALMPLKYLATSSGGMTPAKDNVDYWEGEIPWVSPKDMKRFVLHDSIDHVTEEALEATSLRQHPVDSVLVVVRGMILAHTFPVAINAVPVTVNQDMKVLRATGRVSAKYLAWMLRGLQPLILSLAEESAHGTKALRTEQWANQPVPVPSPREQVELVAQFEKWERETCELSAHLVEHIDRLGEYRSSLISAAVTGQMAFVGLKAAA
ncbi:MAG: restriction endonuclease subunit S [Telluria sp.]